MQRAAVIAIVALALTAVPTATSATTYIDSLNGIEIGATSTHGTFAGAARGSLRGGWKATVIHTRLSPGATITGGSFTLLSVRGVVGRITGAFTSGTVSRITAGSGCTKQRYSIIGTLGSVGPAHRGTGTGTFTGTLIHYRASVLGHCVTYGASISGALSVSF